VTSENIIAQPNVAWMRMYNDGRTEGVYDLYKVFREGYVMCGKIYDENNHRESCDSWIVKVDNDGQEIWSRTYAAIDEMDYLFSVIEADNGDYVAVGPSLGHVGAIRVDRDGEQIWRHSYASGTCSAVIELKSGEFLIAGSSSRLAYLVCINGDGEALWEERYGGDNFNLFYCLRETEGGVVLVGKINTGETLVWIVKVDFDGEIIWERRYRAGRSPWIVSMVSAGDGGFALAGFTYAEGFNTDVLVMKVDNEGELEWSEQFEYGDREWGTCINRLENDDFIVVGRFGQGDMRPLAIRLTPDGQERWHTTYQFRREDGFGPTGNSFKSVVIGHDGSIIAAGSVNFQSGNGLLMKLVPEFLEPQFLSWSPEDTVFSVLQGDTVQFSIEVYDQQDDELSIYWIMGEDTLSRDTSATIIFEELGDFNVQVQTSDGEFTSAITWHVSVVEWLIQACTPDSLDLIIRRDTDIDFSLDVAAIEDIELNYLWTHIDRGGHRHEIGEADSVNMLFDLMGNQRMEGFVWHGERSDEVLWNIDVRSVIWFYLPDITSLTVPVDTTIEFAVTPFNDNSDSLSYYWMLNEDTLEIDVRIASISFPDTGLQEVVSYVWDGGEMDSIMWEITVIPPVSAPESNVELLPMEPMLYPPSPNPFNSSVSLSFYLPRDEYVTLSVFDLNGRKVSSLVNSRQIVGGYTFTWNAAYPSAGMYLVVWQAGNVRRVEKLVLVK